MFDHNFRSHDVEGSVHKGDLDVLVKDPGADEESMVGLFVGLVARVVTNEREDYEVGGQLDGITGQK